MGFNVTVATKLKLKDNKIVH